MLCPKKSTNSLLLYKNHINVFLKTPINLIKSICTRYGRSINAFEMTNCNKTNQQLYLKRKNKKTKKKETAKLDLHGVNQ